MISVILVIHLILAVTIIGMILIQRSEGGGIGLGTGGGLGSFATPQATASALNRTTWFCVAGFFVTSLLLGILYNHASSKRSVLDQVSAPVAATTAPAIAGETTDTNSAKVKDAPIVPDTAPPATKTKAKVAPKPAAESKTKKSEPSVPVSP